MFKAGAAARLQEILGQPAMEKSATGLIRAGVNFAKSAPTRVKNFALRQSPKSVQGVHGGNVYNAPGELVSRGTMPYRPTVQHVANNRGLYGAAAGAAGGVGAAGVHFNNERNNFLENQKRLLDDWQKSQGLDGLWGRTKMLLNYLVGGQGYATKTLAQAANFGSQQNYLTRGNRRALAEFATRHGNAPANVVVAN